MNQSSWALETIISTWESHGLPENVMFPYRFPTQADAQVFGNRVFQPAQSVQKWTAFEIPMMPNAVLTDKGGKLVGEVQK